MGTSPVPPASPWELIEVPAAPLLILLPADVPMKIVVDGPCAVFLQPHGGPLGGSWFWLLAPVFDLAQSLLLNHLGSNTLDERPFFLSLSLTQPFK